MAPSTSLFDRWSNTYDAATLQRSTYKPVHDALLRRIDGLQPGAVLDLGCGTGQLTRRLHQRFPEAVVVGVDYSSGMLASAAGRLGSDATLVRGDAQMLPLKADSIDLVTCTESFHWYPDQQAAARGLARVIAPGGRLLLASIATITGPADDALRRVTTAVGRPVRALPPRRLRRLLEDAGFDVTHQARVPRAGLVPWPVLTDARRV